MVSSCPLWVIATSPSIMRHTLEDILKQARRSAPAQRLILALIFFVSSLGVVFATSVTARASIARSSAAATPIEYVDENIGTTGGGNTSPDAAAPFGMIEWGPAVLGRPPGDYSASQPTVGLSLTNLPGTGCPGLGDIPILPISGALPSDPESAVEPVKNARSQPGTWTGQIGTRGVVTKLAVTTRTGIASFTFPADRPSHVLFKIGDSSAGNSGATARIVGSDEVVGSATGGSFCGRATPYTLYFVARFAKPFRSYGSWTPSRVTPGSNSTSGAGSGVWLNFGKNLVAKKVTMKIGISYVSQQNAALNLHAEDAGWSTNVVASQTQKAWNADLGAIQVSGGTTTQLTLFYSALYHSLLAPETYSDVNGQYLRFGCSTIGQSCEVETSKPGHVQYSEFSGWDIQVSEIPLLAILFPQIASDMATSLVNDALQGGAFPRWTVANYETGVMEGDPADEIIAEAYAFGAQGFDVPQALQLLVRGATDPAVGTAVISGQETYQERGGLSPYEDLGYVSSASWYAASLTLQLATDDFAVSRIAQNLGDTTDASALAASSNNWSNIYNPSTSTMEGKDASGNWIPTSYLGNVSQMGFLEGNAAQYTWSVPQNLPGLFAAMGGDAAAIANLDQFFSTPSKSVTDPYYTAANEPDLTAPWEYDATSAPWKTQALTRSILDESYGTGPNGLPGNDDLGELSSWAVWDMLGLYPLVPGTDVLAIGAPLFPQVTVRPTDGSSVTIDAQGAGDGAPYVQSVALDGQSVSSSWFEWNRLDPAAAVSTTVAFVMGPTPNTGRTSAASMIPAIAGTGYTSTWNRASEIAQSITFGLLQRPRRP
jgi:predicted alpha-1,2-mannosidase